MGYIREVTPEDVAWLAPRLRAADREELRVSTGIPPEIALARGVARSAPCFAGVSSRDDQLALLFGAGPDPRHPDTGIVWLVGSDLITQRPLEFSRLCRPMLAELHRAYPLLWNLVHARNVVHVNWLRWMGFSFLKLHPRLGVGREPFYEFARLECAIGPSQPRRP